MRQICRPQGEPFYETVFEMAQFKVLDSNHIETHCTGCARETVAVKIRLNHNMHLWATALTFVWGYVWIVLSYWAAGRYRCLVCGKSLQV